MLDARCSTASDMFNSLRGRLGWNGELNHTTSLVLRPNTHKIGVPPTHLHCSSPPTSSIGLLALPRRQLDPGTRCLSSLPGLLGLLVSELCIPPSLPDPSHSPHTPTPPLPPPEHSWDSWDAQECDTQMCSQLGRHFNSSQPAHIPPSIHPDIHTYICTLPC